jgi:hypothetical protein
MTFLDKVKDVWEPARGFVVLMRYNVLNDEQIDALFNFFKDVVKTTSDEQKKWKLQKAILAVENIRTQEQSSNSFETNLDEIL